MVAVAELANDVGTSAACQALCMPRASYYRDVRKTSFPGVSASRPSPARALRPAEREAGLARLHEERFQDRSPAAVYATLLDEGEYHCSIRTMYRLLDEHGEVRERRDQLTHPPYQKPELLATAQSTLELGYNQATRPCEMDVFLLVRDPRCFQPLRHRLDGHSPRKRRAGQAIDGELQETMHPTRPTHAPCGSWHLDRSKPVALLLADLGVTKTHSRPHVSDDNPYSESQFRTMKYRPEFPDRFGSLQDSRAFCQSFFRWYNDEHRHSGIGLLTPATVHYGQAENVLRQRQDVLEVAYQRHPERFVRSAPKPPALPSEVWINKPASCQQQCTLEKRNAPEENKSRDAVGRPSWRSSFLGDPGAKFLCEKPNA